MVGRRVRPAAALQIGENPIAALAMQRFQMLAEAILVIHAQLFPLEHSPLGRFIPTFLR
jgi:hypothetical protein